MQAHSACPSARRNLFKAIRSVHPPRNVACVRLPFAVNTERDSIIRWTTRRRALHPVRGRLGCSCLLATVSNAALNAGVPVAVRVPAVASEYIPGSEIADHTVLV